MDEFIHIWINSNKIFTGIIMILMNLGSKYISLDIPLSIENIFKKKEFRIFFVFCVVFISTHDFKISILITLLFILFFKFLLNDNSSMCLLTEKYKNIEVTDKEYQNALITINNYKKK